MRRCDALAPTAAWHVVQPAWPGLKAPSTGGVGGPSSGGGLWKEMCCDWGAGPPLLGLLWAASSPLVTAHAPGPALGAPFADEATGTLHPVPSCRAEVDGWQFRWLVACPQSPVDTRASLVGCLPVRGDDRVGTWASLPPRGEGPHGQAGSLDSLVSCMDTQEHQVRAGHDGHSVALGCSAPQVWLTWTPRPSHPGHPGHPSHLLPALGNTSTSLHWSLHVLDGGP